MVWPRLSTARYRYVQIIAGMPIGTDAAGKVCQFAVRPHSFGDAASRGWLRLLLHTVTYEDFSGDCPDPSPQTSPFMSPYIVAPYVTFFVTSRGEIEAVSR